MAKDKKEEKKTKEKKSSSKDKKSSSSSKAEKKTSSSSSKTKKIEDKKSTLISNEPKPEAKVEVKAEKVEKVEKEVPKSPAVDKKEKKSSEKPQESAKKSAASSYEAKRIGYEDMTTMENMTLEGVLENLRARYAEDLVYTYTSSILVAINPYKRLPIYTDRFVKQYKGNRLGLLPPHIFAIAETAYTQMMQNEKNQSVLVSGESGAGKTESTKLILQFLSARTDRTSNIEKMVLASVPVLEAMGNAKTGRNDNSSRFGKLIKIQFDQDYYITGSTMSTYLLEKSRLIFQSPGERNFHIFYQMTNGMTKEEKERYFLREAEYYNYINKSGCYTVAGVDEHESLTEFRDALKLFDINPELEDHMFRVLATVLHLGNIGYSPKGDSCQLDGPVSEEQLKICSTLLSLNQDDLLFALTHKEIKMRNELINKPLTAEQARDQTDALAKYLYSVLFDWLVSQLNSCTHAETYRSFIGVLDIFGFEVFEKNLLEQFLINYANEKLQQFFNHQIFKLEQKIYEEEKIDWTVIEFKDNQECLDLIEQRKVPGLLSILDEECKFPRATDETLINKLHDNFFKKHPYYDKPRLAQNNFIVRHFAGEVNYFTVGWRDKNKDELPLHLSKCISNSTNMFIAILYSFDEEAAQSSGPGAGGAGGEKGVKKGPSSPGIKLNLANASPGQRKLDGDASNLGGGLMNMNSGAKGSGKETVCTQFRNQLFDLMELLSATEPYFIRCVKPNPQKVPDNFDQELIYNQLLYAGMLETIRIRRMGYPIRHAHSDFFKRFRCICPEVGKTDDIAQTVTALIKALKLNIPYQTQIGVTKVFLKQETANELEDRRNFALTHIIKVLQKWWLCVWNRVTFVEKKTSSLLIQKWYRESKARSSFLAKRKGALLIQAFLKSSRAMKLLKFLREKKRKEEEEKRRREEEERQKAIAKYGREKVEAEEALRKKLEAEKDEAEKEKIRRLLAGEAEEQIIIEEKKEKKKKKRKGRLNRTGSILMDKNEVVEVPINVDGRLTVGLGWNGKKYEMDASVLMFRYRQHHDDVYKFKPRSKDGAVIHKVGWSGNLSLITTIGGETNDQHQIDINLNRLTDKVNTLIFIVTLFTNGANFSDIQDTYLRLIDSSTKKEYCRYNIESSGKETAKIMCKLFRYGYSAWRLKAIGHPSQGRLYKHMISKVNAFLDPQPPKRKFKITIHKAKINPKGDKSLDANISTFCQLRFDLDSSKTRVVKRSLEPTFNSNFEVEGCASTIEVSLMQKRGFSKQSLMARAVILVIDNMKHNEEWFTFEDEEIATCSGQVKVSIDDA